MQYFTLEQSVLRYTIYQLIQDKVFQAEIKLELVRSEERVADILTKGLANLKFK